MKIAVVMNVFEEHDWIVDAIRQMKHPRIEHFVVIDSGSGSEATLDLARFACAEIGVPIVTGHCDWDTFAKRRNYALLVARSIVVGATHAILLDPDERYAPGALDAAIAAIDKDPENVACISARYFTATSFDQAKDPEKIRQVIAENEKGWDWVPRIFGLNVHEPIECTEGGVGYLSFLAHELPNEWYLAGEKAGKKMTRGGEEKYEILHFGDLLHAKRNKEQRDGENVRKRLLDPKDRYSIGFAAAQAMQYQDEHLDKADEMMGEVDKVVLQGGQFPVDALVRWATCKVWLSVGRGNFGVARQALKTLRGMLPAAEADLDYTEARLLMVEAMYRRSAVGFEGPVNETPEELEDRAAVLSASALASGKMRVYYGMNQVGAGGSAGASPSPGAA